MAARTAELIAKLTDQVSGPANSMAGALKGTTSALDALKAKAGRVDAFKQASKSLDDASQKLKVAQQNIRRIKAEMDAAGDGGTKLASSLKSAERAAEAAKNAFKSQGREVRAMRSDLEQAGVPINRLAAYERQLRAEIDHTTSALNKQKTAAHTALAPLGGQRGAGGLSSRIAAAKAEAAGGAGFGGGALAGAGLARFGAAAAGVGGAAIVVGDQIRRAARSSMDFEKAMIEVGKATDSKGPELDAYGERLLKLSRETGKTKEDLASMLASAGFAGRPKEELMDFTEYASKATVAWSTSAEETGQAMAEIGNIYGANQKRIEEVGDAINAMADNSASKETDLLEFLRRAGASGKEAGISAEKMLAFGAAMKEVGVRNETAGTAMEAFLNVMKLGEEFSKKAGEGIKGLGLESTKMRKAFVAKPVETMVDLLERLNKVSDPLKKAEIMTNLFGKEYQDDMAKLLNALPKINQYLGMMGDKAQIAKSSVRGQFSENLGKDVQKIAMATAALDEAYKRLGDPIKSALGGYADMINKAADRLESANTPLQRLLKRFEAEDKKDKPPEAGPAPVTDPIARYTTKAIGLFDSEFAKAGAANDLAIADAARIESVRKVAGLEQEIADIRTKALAAGGGERGANAAARYKEAELRFAKKALADAEKDTEAARIAVAKLDPTPLRFGADPTAPMRGAPGPITPGTKSWQDAFPLVFGTRNVPLPPVRPSSLPTSGASQGIGSIDDVLGPGGSRGAGTFGQQRTPLPPRRPAGLGSSSDITLPEIEVKVDNSQLDETKRKAEELNGTTIAPKADGSALAPLGTEADAAKDKLTALDAMSVSPTVNAGSVDAFIGKLDTAIAKVAQLWGRRRRRPGQAGLADQQRRLGCSPCRQC